MIPEGLSYTKEHEWVRIEGDSATLGITDYAQSQLGDITFVELPQVGSKVSQSKELTVVESVKAATDIFAPLSGEVIEVNASLEDEPEKMNASPYEDGWICRIRIADPSEAEGLLDHEAYASLVEECEA